MRTFALMAVLFALAFGSGCAFRKKKPDLLGNPDVLVEDVKWVIAREHPPAKTRLRLEKVKDDAFAERLLFALRQAGYAVDEGGGGKDGLPVSWVLDEMKNENLMRVSVELGSSVYSRTYQIGENNEQRLYSPIGQWSRLQK